MQEFRDYQERRVRLTDERLEHIRARHPELIGIEYVIGETLNSPDSVVQDEDDEEVFIYRRWYTGIYHGDKWVVVVVVIHPDDAFISTAYVTSEL